MFSKDADIDRERRQWHDSMPQSYRQNYREAHKSKAKALKAKCLDCCCWQRVEITNCPVITCPLWEHRPYQGDLRKKTRKRGQFTKKDKKSKPEAAQTG